MITTCTVNLRFDNVLRMWDTNVKERPCPIIDPEVVATVRAVAQLQLFFALSIYIISVFALMMFG